MRLTTFRSAALAAIVSAAAIVPTIAHAQPSNFLVKGSSSTVYYNADNGNRYFFPNESVFKSWFTDFTTVAQISDTELAALTLAGNVTYRPGSIMVKITTDPKVYAVSRYGVLHWVTSESLATQLYGADWNKHIADVPDEYFTNYIVGSPINAVTDFSPSAEMASTTTPEDNIRPAGYVPPTAAPSATPPSTTNAPTINVTLSSSNAVQNQTITVNATVSSSTLPIMRIEIHSSVSGYPLQTCYNATNCSYSFTVATAPLNVTYYATVYDTSGASFSSPVANRPTLTVSASSDQLQLTVQPQSVTVGSRVNFTGNITNPPTITEHSIFALIPGEPLPVLWKDCGNATTCASSSPFYRNTYLYSQVVSGGQTLTSPEVLITVTGGSAPHPTLTVTGHPAPNQVEITLAAPSGETIGQTLIQDGTTLDDNTLAICGQSSCVITLQVLTPGSVTAFTWVGGKYEASNIITVTPQ